LAEWRKQKGWTQLQLAQALGCAQPYVSLMERAVNPSVPGAALMVEIFDLTEGAVQPNDFYALPEIAQKMDAA
jgi:transcriptional regulator with XRE-family HTH domain